jgi:hypothetical protein
VKSISNGGGITNFEDNREIRRSMRFRNEKLEKQKHENS